MPASKRKNKTQLTKNIKHNINAFTANATTYVTDPVYVTDPTVVYCEPDYVDIGGAIVYADGTVVSCDEAPDCYQEGGRLYCSDGTVRPGNCDTDYFWTSNARIYSDGTVVCD